MVRSLGLALVLVAGCAHSPISEQLRHEARRDLSFRMVRQQPQAYQGSLVIWGGEIIASQSTRTGTLLYVVERPLEGEEQPADSPYTQGRFIAETPRLLDPAVFKPGKRITIAGTVAGVRSERLGERDYAYPLVEIEQIAVWEPPQPVAVAPEQYPWDWGYDPAAWDWSLDWSAGWGPEGDWEWGWERDWGRPELYGEHEDEQD